MPPIQSNDNADQFLSIVEGHKGIIYKIANAYCGNAEDRKDLVQEVIVQLWRSFDNYNSQYKYSTWIYRITLNVAISFYRKDNRIKRITDPISDSILDVVDAGQSIALEKNIGFLQQFISELKELDKALMLLYLDERSYKEIAEIIGLTETNVATKIGRIKGVLKQKFSQIKS